MTAKIHIERMMHRNSIVVAGESAISYALVKLIPSGLGDGVQTHGAESGPGARRQRLHVRGGRHRHRPSQTRAGRRHRRHSETQTR